MLLPRLRPVMARTRVRSRALVSAGRRRRFATSVYLRGFTPILERKLQLPGLLALGVSEIHSRFALLSVRPFAPSEASEGRGLPCSAPRSATTASADFSLRFAASPFQARGEISPGKSPDLHGTVAGFTSVAFGRESFADFGPLALAPAASYPVSVRPRAASAPRFFQPRPHGLRLAWGPCDPVPQRTCTSMSGPCWAHQKTEAPS